MRDIGLWGVRMIEYYTWEELIELGCPPQLVMQYIWQITDKFQIYELELMYIKMS